MTLHFTLDGSVATLGKRRDLGRVAISRPLVGSLLGSKGRTSHREMRLAQDFFSFVKWLIFPGFSFNSIVLIYAPMHGHHIFHMSRTSTAKILSYYTMFGVDALGIPSSRENCRMIGSIASAPALYSLPCLYSFQRLINGGQL